MIETPTDMDPVASETVLGEHQLDPRFIPHQLFVGRIVSAVISVGSLIFLLGGPITQGRVRWVIALPVLAGWLVVSGLLVWMSERWPAIAYRHTSYRVDQDGVEIRRGVWWREVINVPRTRVQHTDVSQGPLERRYGLGTLVVHTAGTEHARVELAGLEHGRALSIRDYLLPRDTRDAV